MEGISLAIGTPLLKVPVTVSVTAAGFAQSPHEAAVLEARAGRPDAAIATLRALFGSGPADPLVGPDRMILLQQNGRPAEALAVLRRLTKQL